MTTSCSRRNVGLYGLRVEGFDDPALNTGVPKTWAPLEVHTLIADCADDAPIDVDDDSATMGMPGIGEIRVTREPASVLVRSRRPVDGDILIHPALGWAAWVIACWNGKSVLHGAAFVGENGAWVVLGERGAGKSTLMAALAQRGVAVLADDITVIDGGCVFAGPRRIDLRPDAAGRLGLKDTGLIRGKSRRGLPLTPVESTVPLSGFVRLRWGEEVSTTPVPPFDRIRALDKLVGSSVSKPSSVLDIVSLPMTGLVRPRSWTAIEASADAILSEVAE